jgi:hypothetical protein
MHGGCDLRRFYRYDWCRQDIQIIAEMGRVGWRGKQFATGNRLALQWINATFLCRHRRDQQMPIVRGLIGIADPERQRFGIGAADDLQRGG